VLGTQSWSRGDPVDFVTTATTELDGSSFSGSYGPPYNNGTGAVQHLGFIHLQDWLGISHPINSAQDFVLAPLRSITGQPALQAAVSTYEAAPAKTQTGWTRAYETALAKATTPGVRDLPRRVPIYKLIWRDHYRSAQPGDA
jgi:hypothetical protein